VKLLIGGGADVNAKDVSGKTPLHWAVTAEQTEIVRILLANGADVNAKDCKPPWSDGQGNTPLNLVPTVYTYVQDDCDCDRDDLTEAQLEIKRLLIANGTRHNYFHGSSYQEAEARSRRCGGETVVYMNHEGHTIGTRVTKSYTDDEGEDDCE
jgi:hypothetical protein